MKTKTIIFGILFTIANLCFASSVFEPTPFLNWSENNKRVDRVNLWPLFYYQDPNMSILWPMIDKRGDGNAVRPFYSIYNNGDELNILWPLCTFNFKHKDYRIGNVNYGGRKTVIFPISYFDFNRKKYWIINTYWDKRKFVFFPMYFYEKNDHWLATFIAGKGKDWYSVMPPMWISSYNNTNHSRWFFGPLGMYNSNKNGRYKFSALFKIIDYKSFKDNKELNILFLNRYLTGKYSRDINFFYLSRYTKTRTDEEFYFFPFVYTYSSLNKKQKTFFPLYFSKENKKRKWQLLFPLFYKSSDEKENILITPLFGMLTGKNAKRIITPVISFNKNEDEKFINILALGYNRIWNDKKDYSRTDIIWPVLNYTKNKDEKSTSIIPVFGLKKSTNSYRFISPVVSLGNNHKKKKRFVNIGGILFHHFQKELKKGKKTGTFFCWPLFFHEKAPQHSDTYSFPLFRYEKTTYKKSGYIIWPLYNYSFKKNGGYNYSFLYELFERRKDIRKRGIYAGAIDNGESITQNVTKIFMLGKIRSGVMYKQNHFPIPEEIKEKNGCLDKDKINVHTNLWKTYANKNWYRQKYKTVKTPITFSYKWYENERGSFDILYWLYESKWTAAHKNKPEKSERKILWWFMNYKKTGKNVSLDVFPFITYDKVPGEEISQFSVFWRLFRWREEKEKRALDLLFIPFRWGK